MNQLNSVIIEGNITETDYSDGLCTFTVENIRKYTYEEETIIERNEVEVHYFGKTADRLSPELRKERGVRVVGRLKQNEKIILIAEHVELKPWKVSA